MVPASEISAPAGEEPPDPLGLDLTTLALYSCLREGVMGAVAMLDLAISPDESAKFWVVTEWPIRPILGRERPAPVRRCDQIPRRGLCPPD